MVIGPFRGPMKGKYTKNRENEKMHKTMREQSSEFNNGTRRLQIWFWSFWEALYFFEKLLTFLIFRPPLRHQGWCQNIAQRSPKLFGKSWFLTLQTFFGTCPEHVKTCILSSHIMSYNMISYDILSYEFIWYSTISYHRIWYHLI